jgi:hypothetical protein
MHQIQDNVGLLVANETQCALRAIDNAILTELRLCATLVEAFDTAGLPVGRSQKLLQTLASGLNLIVAGRGEMAQTVRTLTAIKTGSNLRTTSYNCPTDKPPLLTGQASEQTSCSADAVFG